MSAGVVDENQIYKMPKQFAGVEIAEIVSEIRGFVENCSVYAVLDFKDTVVVDSSGIGNLVALSQDLRVVNKRLILRGLRQEVLRIFVETGIDSFFDIENLGRIKPAGTDFVDNSVAIRLTITNKTEGDVSVLCLSGIMNHPEGSNLFKQKMLLAMVAHQKILLDLGRLAYFDSLSVGTLLKLSKLLKQTGGGLRVCAPNCIVQDLFSTLNIDVIIPIYNSRQDALIDWNSNG